MYEEIYRNLYLRDLALGKRQGPLTNKPSIDKVWLKHYTEEAIMSESFNKNIYDYIYYSNKKNSNKVALNYLGRKITFLEFFINVECATKAFRKYGIKKGDIVTIVSLDTPELVYMFYALNRLGAISDIIRPNLLNEEMIECINNSDSKMLVILDDYLDKAIDIKNNTNIDNVIITSLNNSLPLRTKIEYKIKSSFNDNSLKEKIDLDKNYIKWNAFLESGMKFNNNPKEVSLIGRYRYPLYEKDRPAVIIHPIDAIKDNPIILSNDNINTSSLQKSIILKENNKKYTDIASASNSDDIEISWYLPLFMGKEAILTPQIYSINNKNIEEIVSNFFRKDSYNYYQLQGYNKPETNGSITYIDNKHNENDMGIPLVKTVVSIFDFDTGEELGYNEKGEICITGPSTMLGYLNNKVDTDIVLKKHSDGKIWVHSGDRGHITSDGRLYVDPPLEKKNQKKLSLNRKITNENN